MSLTEVKNIYFDESGNTGENLIDPAQPVFVLGSVSIERSLADSLVNKVLHQLPKRHGEPKYSSLTKTKAGRKALIQCISSLPHDVARFYAADKRFFIEAKIIDLLIEPLFFKQGHNMYADGSAVGLANLMHAVGPVLGDKAAYENVLKTFVRAFRSRPTATLDDIYRSVDEYRVTTATPEWQEWLEVLSLTRSEAEAALDWISNGHRDELDPATPCLVALVRDTGERLGVFRLVHDKSETITRYAHILENLHEIGNPTRPGKRLAPLPITSIDFLDSKDSSQLQVADWIAGAGRQWTAQLLRMSKDPFAQELGRVIKGWLIGAVWPDRDAIDTPSPRLIDLRRRPSALRIGHCRDP
jgi:Protein of unknown function (DUF3800)